MSATVNQKRLQSGDPNLKLAGNSLIANKIEAKQAAASIEPPNWQQQHEVMNSQMINNTNQSMSDKIGGTQHMIGMNDSQSSVDKQPPLKTNPSVKVRSRQTGANRNTSYETNSQQQYNSGNVYYRANSHSNAPIPPKEIIRKSYKGGGRLVKDSEAQKWTNFPMKVQNMNSMVQIRKRKPKMTFQDKIAYHQEQERQIYTEKAQSRGMVQRKCQKVLDALLLAYSCRVKNPSQAIRSKLAGENIVDVREEELYQFTSLTHLDVSDNQIQLNQLINLISMEELDMQYNNLSFLALAAGVFPKLHTLRLSFNKIPPSHLIELGHIYNLQALDIASNDFCTLPNNMGFFKQLQELDLSSNNFNSDSVLVNPNQLFLSLSTITHLKKLNLSRNKLKAFHYESLPENNLTQPGHLMVFAHLEELNFSFNNVEFQQNLYYSAKQLPRLHTLVISGNPFAITGVEENYKILQKLMDRREGVLINETLKQAPSHLYKPTQVSKQTTPLAIMPDLQQPMMVSSGNQAQNEMLFQGMKNEPEQQNQMEKEPNFFLTGENVQGDYENNQQTEDQEANPIISEVNQHQKAAREELTNKTDQETYNENEDREDMFKDDYGKVKMEVFNLQCRNILGVPAEQIQATQQSQMNQSRVNQSHHINASYNNDLTDLNYSIEQKSQANNVDMIDIVTAYKSLKLAMNKNMRGLEKGREHINGKGYLKPTISTRQAKRLTLGYPPLGMGAYAGMDSQLPPIRGQTAPDRFAVDQQQSSKRPIYTSQEGTRNNRRGNIGQQAGVQSKTMYGGMTLQDYAKQGEWGEQNNASSNTRASTRGIPRTATAPCWRKSKAQRVDEKVQKLLTGYNDAASTSLAMSEHQKRAQITAKYFPGKDVPLGSGGMQMGDEILALQN